MSDNRAKLQFQHLITVQDRSLATQEASLERIDVRLEENRAEVHSTRTYLQTVGSNLMHVRQLGSEILSFVQKIWNIHVMTYRAIETLQSRLPTQLERTWTQEPVILKDPLGRTMPVHLDFIEIFRLGSGQTPKRPL